MVTGGNAEKCFPKKVGLTKRQKECLDFIKVFKNRNGEPPTLSQMCSHLGFSGTGNGIVRLLDCLEARGHIRRSAHRARGLEIL